MPRAFRLSEVALGLIYVAVFLNGIGTLLGHPWLACGLKALPDLCLFHRLSGLLCPGCGMTRAFLALGALDLRAAVSLNPFSPILFLLGLGWFFLNPQRVQLPRFASRSLLVLVVLFGVSRNLGL